VVVARARVAASAIAPHTVYVLMLLQFVVVCALQNCLNVPLSASYCVFMCLKLEFLIARSSDADLGQFDTDWLAHEALG